MAERRFDIPHDGGFVEVADRCWVARHRVADVNVGVVAGSRGLLVVDTHSSARTARSVVEQVRALGAGEVVAVVNTHAHWDHVLGNATFVEEYDAPPVVAHEEAAAAVREDGAAMVDRLRDTLDMTGTTPVVPDRTFSSARVVDLGDRIVEVAHLGRGHTGGDAIAHVEDAKVLYAGDLVEESGVPGFGDDCFPLEWADTLDLMIGMLSAQSVVVPGHGAPVDKEFVMHQRASIGAVADGIRDLAGQGVGAGDMAQRTAWPYPVEDLEHAFLRGTAQLPRGGRALPLA
jgi:glyoxylase-like metal-dependent hydrolase (beta-lactamase superfamily II)